VNNDLTFPPGPCMQVDFNAKVMLGTLKSGLNPEKREGISIQGHLKWEYMGKENGII